MDNHFIKTIGIENFKCFEKLSITGIESVNLIGGKNNIGKTAFLEAIELFVSSNDANTLALNMYHMLTRRQGDINKNERYTVDFIKDKEKEVRIYTDTKISEIKMHLNQQQSFFEEPEEGEAERNEIISITHLSFLINKDEKSFPVNKLLRRNMLMRVDNINFIRSEKIGEQELANLYGALVDL
ncbi:MAG: AAA family ATPase, partial [Thiomargarita sp.]|nr:AAA family ATPase [Thiomargarita sp.]